MRCPVCGNEKGERHVCASCGTALYDEIRSPYVQEDISPEPYIIFIWPDPLQTRTIEMTKGQFIVASSLVLGTWILPAYLLLSHIILEATSGLDVAINVLFLILIPAMWFFFWASGRGEVVERQRKEECFGPPFSEKRP